MMCLPGLSPEQLEVESSAHGPHCVLSPSQLHSVVEVPPSTKDTVLLQLDTVTITADDLTNCTLQNCTYSYEVIILLYYI